MEQRDVAVDGAQIRAQVPSVGESARAIPPASSITHFNGACSPEPTQCTSYTCYGGGCEHPTRDFSATLASTMRQFALDAQSLRARAERFVSATQSAIEDLETADAEAARILTTYVEGLDGNAPVVTPRVGGGTSSGSAYADAIASRRDGGLA